ncbi:FAD-dependent oxidoreductase [Actinoplanes sp. NPDC049118]|uniref:FAD-dependent oxidoreductase n=1 Tax=Actinoplanes sp. NPDC049118 TaxID=3155769 RepID=UPI0033CFE1D4
MSTARTDVLIVGAGVSGLTTGVRLAERGLRVRVRTARGPARSTSAAAGAMWDPMHAHHPDMKRWSRRTHEVFENLDGVAGVKLVDGTEASRDPIPLPERCWEMSYRECKAPELPDGFATGWRYMAPLIDMPVYLAYLLKRLKAAGGKVEYGRLRTLDEAFATASVVVNCAGSAARELVPDDRVTSVCGHLVLVRNPGIREFFVEHTDDLRETTYLLPQGRVLVLGGNATEGCVEPVLDRGIAAGIRNRCISVFPEVAKAKILGYRVGSRPVRPEVRLEIEPRGSRRHVVHNYGHAGSGVSLSWGCADDVAMLVDELV